MNKFFIVGILVILAAVLVKEGIPNAEPEIKEVQETPVEVPISVEISPSPIQQGEPAKITITGTTTIKSLTWNGKRLDTFTYNGKPTALVGIDLKMRPGPYPLTLSLTTGETIQKDLTVDERKVIEAPLGIPDKLGGNTPQAEQQLISSLAQENAILASLSTAKEVLWSTKFEFPLSNVFITDHYGYTRLTGASIISHKGTDFRAPAGTEVYAMNSGTVKLAREFRAYGNTVVIDHGFGLQTLYMHLSELGVKNGETVTKGQIIGKSGMTGYAEQPHLHVSVKIDGISIDPMKFLELF